MDLRGEKNDPEDSYRMFSSNLGVLAISLPSKFQSKSCQTGSACSNGFRHICFLTISPDFVWFLMVFLISVSSLPIMLGSFSISVYGWCSNNREDLKLWKGHVFRVVLVGEFLICSQMWVEVPTADVAALEAPNNLRNDGQMREKLR